MLAMQLPLRCFSALNQAQGITAASHSEAIQEEKKVSSCDSDEGQLFPRL